MPGFDGTGPNGMGPMTGGGRGGCAPRGAGAGQRRYNFFQQAPYAYPRYGLNNPGPYAPRITREQELEFLKNEAKALKDELKNLENVIEKLSTEKK